MDRLGAPDGPVGVVGGTEVFGLFLDRYDIFQLSRAPGVKLPSGRPVFPGVPARTPEQVLVGHGLALGEVVMLDSASGVSMEKLAAVAPPKRHRGLPASLGYLCSTEMNGASPPGRSTLATITASPTATVERSPGVFITTGTPGGTVMVRTPCP